MITAQGRARTIAQYQVSQCTLNPTTHKSSNRRQLLLKILTQLSQS